MGFVQYISTRKCGACGKVASCARVEGDIHICRTCNPENWEKSAELEKQSWITGDLEAADA